MSLTSLLRGGPLFKADSLCRRLIDSILLPQQFHRPTGPSVSAPDRAIRPGWIGTAADYAIRIELKRRVPTASERQWVADNRDAQSDVYRGERYFRAATQFAKKYQEIEAPSLTDWRNLARWSLRLAEIDLAARSRCSPDIESCLDRKEWEGCISEVMELARGCPWEALIALCRDGRAWLNPTFGAFSEVVGGADADLVLGGALIEIKTTWKPHLDRSFLRQLAGYYMLARAYGTSTGEMPVPNMIGILFARQGYLWTCPVEEFVDMQKIETISPRFVRRASRVWKGQCDLLGGWRAPLGITPRVHKGGP